MVRPAFLALIFETEYHADYSMLCWNKNKPTGFVIVMILCVCITLQMLGVPATLLNPAGGESDTGGGSVLEGFTLLPALVQLNGDPGYARLRADPRYAALRTRLRMPPRAPEE